MSAEAGLREAAQAVLTELDIIRKHREANAPPLYGMVVHIDTHNDLRAALASERAETVHLTVRIDELRVAVQAMVCCSRQGKLGRHDPGCWSGCKIAVLALVGEP